MCSPLGRANEGGMGGVVWAGTTFPNSKCFERRYSGSGQSKHK